MNIPVSCNKDCGAGCPLTALVENGKVVRITDSSLKGRWMSGCARGYNSHKVIYHPDRLTGPLIKNRATGKFREAGWNEALDFTAERLREIREKSGPASVLHLGGGGACRGALHHTGRAATRFFGLFGGCTTSNDSYSSAAVSFVTPYVFGTPVVGIDAGSLADTKFILMPGANFADLRFGCELFNRLKSLRKAGVRMIVIDPRKTRTVTGLDAEWIKINPGTDAAFIAAVIYELVENGGIDWEYVGKYTHGFEAFKEWLYDSPVKNAEWAAAVCGTEADSIKEVAECYRKYRPAALLPGLSIQRNLGGEDAARMMMALQAVTGNTGIPGGSSGGNIWGSMPKLRCGRLGMSPGSAGADIRYAPVYGWADMILNNRLSPPIRAAYNCGGNYLVQGADCTKSAKAFGMLDFSVTHELFMTPTAEMSDVVFPVADYLERSDIVFPEGNFLLYSNRAVEPPEGVKSDFEIFSLLADRLGFGDEYTGGRNEEQWLDFFLSESEIEDAGKFKRDGIWFGTDDSRVALTDYIEDPVKNPLNTPSGKIEISSEKYRGTGGSLFPVFSDPPRSRGFRLITPHSRSRINSQYLHYSGDKKASVMINPADAKTLGISDGSSVRLISDTGVLVTKADLSPDIIEGAACLDCSYSNILTSTEPTLPSGGSRTHSTFIDIEPV